MVAVHAVRFRADKKQELEPTKLEVEEVQPGSETHLPPQPPQQMPLPQSQPLLSPQRLREQLRAFESSSPLLKVRLRSTICTHIHPPNLSTTSHTRMLIDHLASTCCDVHCRITPPKRYRPPTTGKPLKRAWWRQRQRSVLMQNSNTAMAIPWTRAHPSYPKRCGSTRSRQQSSRLCLRLRRRKEVCSVIHLNSSRCRNRQLRQPIAMLERRRILPVNRPFIQRQHHLRKPLSENHPGLKNK